jgi:CheY-like chemotaxis protein
MLRRVIGEHIRVDFLAARHLALVYADRGMMEQVLMNLCVNARDAMPDGGSLTLETENVLINGDYVEIHPWAKRGRYVLVTLTDTGCGMEKQTIDRLFEPFFTTKELGKGTGLGLSTVYGIVKQHDGMINVYSEVDKGSTFKVYLPVSERRAEQVGTKILGAPAGGSETILLAEDEESVCRLGRQILERAGYTVFTARDGEEAVEVFKQHDGKMNLLLFDVIMPQLDGHKAYERIREMQPDIPVLFTSGYNENAVHTSFVLHEGTALLQKPFASEDLLRAVRGVLDNAGKAG